MHTGSDEENRQSEDMRDHEQRVDTLADEWERCEDQNADSSKSDVSIDDVWQLALNGENILLVPLVNYTIRSGSSYVLRFRSCLLTIPNDVDRRAYEAQAAGKLMDPGDCAVLSATEHVPYDTVSSSKSNNDWDLNCGNHTETVT